MKKTILFVTLILLFVLFSCNEHNSANKHNERDASNSTMDETGPAQNKTGDTTMTNTEPHANSQPTANNGKDDNPQPYEKK